MTNIEQDTLIAFVEKMPAFPKSVQRILQLSGNINTSSKDLVQVIETDPVMTIKILKVINSPYYGLSQKISSIQRAVVHIGINTIKNMALVVAAIGVMRPQNNAGFNTGDFLLHSIATATLCKLLAEKLDIPSEKASDFFVAGLLHDFGKIIFAEFAAENYKTVLQRSLQENISLHEIELMTFGVDHSIAGQLLTEHWAFEHELVTAINHHHSHEEHTPLLDCLFAANQISKTLQLGFSGNAQIESLPEAARARFGMDLTELINSLGDLTKIKAEAQLFIHS